MQVRRYTMAEAELRYQGKRNKLRHITSHINGFHVFAEKHCVYVHIPKDHVLNTGMPENKMFGQELVTIVEASKINPVLFGRE